MFDSLKESVCPCCGGKVALKISESIICQHCDSKLKISTASHKKIVVGYFIFSILFFSIYFLESTFGMDAMEKTIFYGALFFLYVLLISLYLVLYAFKNIELEEDE